MGVSVSRCPDCGISLLDRWHGRSNCIAELRAQLARARDAALEEAAQACEAYGNEHGASSPIVTIASRACAARVRARVINR